MKRQATLLTTILLLGAGAAAADYRGDTENEAARVAKRLQELAQAIPAEKFAWRPEAKLRSISEVFMHVASNNFFFARDLGIPLPEGLPEDLEATVTKKAEVIAMLQTSTEHLQKAIAAVDDPDVEIELFGRARSVRSILYHVIGHGHEHLGQSIAYARAIGVVPPWSR